MNKQLWPRAVLTVALRGPGKALLCASAAGWVAMAWLSTTHRLPHVLAGPEALPDFIVTWLAMILAMGPPLLLREIARVWRTSRRRLRPAVIACFLGGYVGIWLLAGIAVAALAGWASLSPARIIGAVAMVAFWCASPPRQRCLNACHRVRTLRVFGAAAQGDSLRYGVSTGGYCAAACGPLMFLIVLAAEYHLHLMAAVAAVTTIERYLPARRPGWQLPVVRGRSSGWPDMLVDVRTPDVGWR